MTTNEYKARLEALHAPESCPDSLNVKIDAVIAEVLRRQLRPDLTEEQKAEALRIGRIEFASAGAVRRK